MSVLCPTPHLVEVTLAGHSFARCESCRWLSPPDAPELAEGHREAAREAA